jgi:hypothetical protein
MIGKGDPAYSLVEYFHGEIDEIRIWSVARSPEQIRAAMSGRLSGREPGLVGYWAFDDGTAKDQTGNGNNGVLDGDSRIVGANVFRLVQRRNMIAVDYAKKPPTGNRVGLHYSRFGPLSTQRAHELSTGYVRKIFSSGSNPRSRVSAALPADRGRSRGQSPPAQQPSFLRLAIPDH